MGNIITFSDKEELQAYLRKGGIVRPGKYSLNCFYDEKLDKYFYGTNEEMTGVYAFAYSSHKWVIVKPANPYKFSF